MQDSASQSVKYDQVALAVATGLLICFLFTVSIKSQYQGGKIQKLEWDVATITAGDYTVEFPIKAEEYAWWKSEVYRGQGGEFESGVAPALAFKKYLAKEVEEKLDAWVTDNPWAVEEVFGKDASERNYGGTKIADIVFSFNNARLIEALRARGASIAAQDFDKMRAQEVKVNELFQEFDSLTVPTAAFITFESDDSKNLALLVSNSDMRLINQKFEFKETSEPTDIIWENRHFTNRDYIFRQLFAFVIIGILLFGSFLVIYIISAYSANLAQVFPPTDCTGIELAYGETLKEYAVMDYNYIASTENEPSSGCLQCFCQQQYKQNPDTYLTDSYGQAQGEPICEQY